MLSQRTARADQLRVAADNAFQACNQTRPGKLHTRPWQSSFMSAGMSVDLPVRSQGTGDIRRGSHHNNRSIASGRT
eukprot:4830215-Alexandrium_andersonii.AAC.1